MKSQEKKILLPLDGSEASLSALLIAKSIAIALGSIVHILYISDETFSQQELIQKLRLKKEELSRFIIDHRQGSPTEIILQEAEKCCYITMSTHGETHDVSKITGRTTASIIEKSKIPVILVRPDVYLKLKKGLWKPEKVLIPLNGTPGAAQALDPVFKILSKNPQPIDLLHIPTPKTASTRESGSLTMPYYEDYPQHEWASWSKEFLKRFCMKINHNDINNIKFNLNLSKGDPAKEIISFAEKNHNDLIAMAWHGTLGHMHAKILKEVIFKTPCPILLIRIV